MKTLLTLLLFVSTFSPVLNKVNPNEDIALMSDTMSGHNSVWHESKLDFKQDFKLGFKTDLSAVYKADGMAIVFTTGLEEADTGPGKGDLGYLGALHVPNSLVLELDGYQNLNQTDYFIQDFDIPIDSSEIHYGHIAFIDTNHLFKKVNDPSYCENNTSLECRKHKSLIDLKTTGYGLSSPKLVGTETEPSKFEVDLTWDAKNKTMTAQVLWFNRAQVGLEAQFQLEYTFDPIEVFGREDGIVWGFSSSSSDRGIDVNVRVNKSELPHQVTMEIDRTGYTSDMKIYNLNLKKSIEQDEAFYNIIEFKSTDEIESVYIDDQLFEVIDGKVDLSFSQTEQLEIVVTLNRVGNKKLHRFEVEYQSLQKSFEEEWIEDETDDPNKDNPGQKPEEKPEEKPGDKPSHKPDNKPGENPKDNTMADIDDEEKEPGRVGDVVNDNDIAFVKPPINNLLPKKKVKSFTIKNLHTGVQGNANFEAIGQQTHANPNFSNHIQSLLSNSSPNSKISLNSGKGGFYDNDQDRVYISLGSISEIPKLHVKEGYIFVGYFDKDGNSILNDQLVNNDFTAQYETVGLSVFNDTLGLLVKLKPYYIILVLILLRFVLNYDIKRRKENL